MPLVYSATPNTHPLMTTVCDCSHHYGLSVCTLDEIGNGARQQQSFFCAEDTRALRHESDRHAKSHQLTANGRIYCLWNYIHWPFNQSKLITIKWSQYQMRIQREEWLDRQNQNKYERTEEFLQLKWKGELVKQTFVGYSGFITPRNSEIRIFANRFLISQTRRVEAKKQTGVDYVCNLRKT